ncbi:RlpA-like double-psi beta-barrel-protein domain-containing protein-containing protein, partial [Ganoderma leucocontextum]
SATGSATLLNVGAGACGQTNVASDSIVAIPAGIYGNGEQCGKTVTITNTVTGQQTTAVVEDQCATCAASEIELSAAVFQQLGSANTNALTVSWDLD